MATATKIKDLNGAADQLSEFNERFVQAGKRAGSQYVESCEKLVENVTGLQQKLAADSHNQTVESVVTRQVDLTRQLTAAYTSAIRQLIA
jgi:hypothetical protein